MPAASRLAAQAACEAAADGDAELEGALVVRHANGERQAVPLRARVARPALSCGVEALDFGDVHPRAPKRLEIILTNPTAVDAAWAVVDAGAPPADAKAAAAAAAAALLFTNGGGGAGGGAGARGAWDATGHLAPCSAALNGALLASMLLRTGAAQGQVGVTTVGSTAAAAAATAGGSTSSTGGGGGASGSAGGGSAAFGAFTVTPASGVIPGRGLGMPCSQRVSVVFAPPDDRPASAALRVAAFGGRGCELRLEGRGTYDEAREHDANLMLL